MIKGTLAFAVFMIFLPGVNFANTLEKQASAINFGKTYDESGYFLQVKHGRLEDILQTISQQTGLLLHSSGLPAELVSVDCRQENLKMLLECAIKDKANMAVRYSKDVQTRMRLHQEIAEAWIIGATANSPQTELEMNGDSTQKLTQSLGLFQSSPQLADKRQTLLAKATQTADTNERVAAIDGLLGLQISSDPEIRTELERALADPDVDVRAQAISTYARLEKADATDAIQQALRDDSADVRMMAVDAITDNEYLLRQAINDSDETVRDLAFIKLNEFNRRIEAKK